MVQFTYRLAETVVRVSAVATQVDDPYGETPESRTLDDVSVELLHAAQPTARVDIDVRGQGDQSIQAAFTADGRLTSVTYAYKGPGAAIIGGAVKVVAFVGSLLVPSLSGALSSRDLDPPGWGKWASEHVAEAKLKSDYVTIADAAAAELASIRTTTVTAPADELSALVARERAVRRVLDDARDEIARVDARFRAWRDAQRSVSTAPIAASDRVQNLPRRTSETFEAPTPPGPGVPGHALWRDFGVYIEVDDPAGGAVEVRADPDEDAARRTILWRMPRTVTLWIWKRGPDEKPRLVSVAPHRIVDRASPLQRMELSAQAFGATGAALTFHEDGTPATLSQNAESAWAAAFSALGDTPAGIAGAVESAKKVVDAATALGSVDAERDRAAAARELEVAKNRLELAGVHATDEDFAALKAAEQALALATARRTLAAG